MGLKECYERERRVKPRLMGKIDLEFTVEKSGHVKVVSVEGFDAAVDRCIREKVLTWRFTKEEEPTDYVVPLIFRP